MKLSIKLNPDLKVQNDIRAAIKNNLGYCPCRLDKTADTKCMCKEFRESTSEGYCHCGLFYKERSK